MISNTVGLHNYYLSVTSLSTLTSYAIGNFTVVVAPASGSGGGGGGGGTVIINSNGGGNETIEVTPQSVSYSVTQSSSHRYEVKVKSLSSEKVTIVATIDGDNNWLTFDGGTKETSFDISPSVGFISPDKFIRYNVVIPANVKLGDYSWLVTFKSGSVTVTHKVTVTVQTSIFSSLFDVLSKDVYTFGASCNKFSTITTECLEPNNVSLKLWHILLTIFTVVIVVMYYTTKKK